MEIWQEFLGGKVINTIGGMKMEKRNVYLEKIEANLAKYNAKLDVMKAKAAEVKADMKLE